MKIVVCVKQVPQASELRFDAATRRVIRAGAPNILNAYDRRAVVEAVRLKSNTGGMVTVLTMGPPQARDVLVECLAIGADRAVHLVDPALAGSDTLATARALARAVSRLEYDLVLCGRQSVDAETGQVGPEVAEILDLPQVTGAAGITVEPGGMTLRVTRETDEGLEELLVPLPALLTAAERLNRPGGVPEAALAEAANRSIQEWSVADLGGEPAEYGAAGSPTWVAEIRTFQPERRRELIDPSDLERAAVTLSARLRDLGLFETANASEDDREPLSAGPHLTPVNRAEVAGARAGGVLVVAETVGDELRRVTLELLGRAAHLAASLDGPVSVLLAGAGVEPLTSVIAAHGADRVLVAEAEELRHYETETYTRLLVAAIERTRPRVVLVPATANGRDLAPRVAARLGLGLTGDCVDLELDAEKRLVQLKPAFGGNVIAPIFSRTRPELATVRPGVFPRRRPTTSRTGVVERLDPALAGLRRTTVLRSVREAGLAGIALDDARVIVGVGTGLGSEQLPLARALASTVGGAIGGTRKVVDLGWLPRQQQIGLSGRAVSPRFYFAVGLRGSFNHAVGIQRAGTIVAINRDPKAEIFQCADLGVLADCRDFLPLLTRELKRVAANESGDHHARPVAGADWPAEDTFVGD